MSLESHFERGAEVGGGVGDKKGEDKILLSTLGFTYLHL